MEKLAKSNSINLGLYLGITLAACIIVAYAINLDLFTNSIFGITLLLIPLIFGIISIVKAKKISNGFLNFKHSFTAYFLTILVGFVIYFSVNYILFNFVDEEAGKTIQENLIELQAEGLQQRGTDEDTISRFIENRESQYQYSILSTTLGLAIYLIGYSIVGLIIAAFMKKNPENDY